MKRLVASALIVTWLIVLSPAAHAGPGSAICRAGTNVYETATGDDAPWSCTY